MRNFIRAAASIGVIAAGGLAVAAEGTPRSSHSPTVSKTSARTFLESAEGRFTENRGQWQNPGKFLSQSRFVDVWVTDDGALFDFHHRRSGSRVGDVVGMRFKGSHSGAAGDHVRYALSGQSPDKGTFGFVKGGVSVTAHRYATVLQHGVYPGIDARYYVDSARPRFDLILAPKADSGQIALNFTGASSVAVRSNAILLQTSVGQVKQADLVAYQESPKGRTRVAAAFSQRNDGSVGVLLGAYDHSRQVVIDPLVYGSYYGGEGGWDDVRSIAEDTDGGIYMVGYTESEKFPALEGPYQFNLNGPRDGFVAKLQGDAYANIYATFVGGSLQDECNFAQLDGSGNLWVAGTTNSNDFPGSVRPLIQYLQLFQNSVGDISNTPDNDFTDPAGTATVAPDAYAHFRLSYLGRATTSLKWNATATDVLNALKALGNCPVTSVTGTLPSRVKIVLSHTATGTISVLNRYAGGFNGVNDPGNNNEDPRIPDVCEGLEPRYLIDVDPSSGANRIIRRGTFPTGGTFEITFINPFDKGISATTAAIPFNATPAQIMTALTGLSNNNGGTWTVSTSGVMPPQFPPFPVPIWPPMLFAFQATATSPLVAFDPKVLFISYNNDALIAGGPEIPLPTYSADIQLDIFVQRWAKQATGLLNPLPTQTLIFGGDENETINGFAVQQSSGTTVNFGFAGNTDSVLAENTTDPFKGAYLARYAWSPTGFQKISVKYLGESAPLLIGGFAMDSAGNGYVAGEIEFGSNDDNPSTDGIFTTVGGWGDNKLRFKDVFVRKYSPDNSTLIYSGILGGNDQDFIGGFDTDPAGNIIPTGSAIAVDSSGNAYVTGVTYSFDFPRTRNVIGPVFVSQPNATMFVSKINPLGNALVYSTSLNTNTLLFYPFQIIPKRIGFGLGTEWLPSPVMPAGIAVDSAGDAFISGNGHPQWISFPDPPGMPGNPNQPTGTALPNIPQVNAYVNPYTTVGTPDLPAAEGFIEVLNPTAQAFLLSTWLGGVGGDPGPNLGEQVFAPYVDKFGDVWVMGNVVTFRGYSRAPTPTGAPTIYEDGAGLPRELVSPLAFKSIGDQTGGNDLDTMYGAYQHQEQYWGVKSEPELVSIGYAVDGFVVKLRVGAPAIQSVTFAPGTVPGGSGAFSTATVTLSAPAPVGGADVQLLLDNPAGSFSATTAVASMDLPIPAGATTATAQVFTNPVTVTTSVNLQATYLGSFQIAQLFVVPWLQGVSVTPNTVVGGNVTAGRVTLGTAAPANGVTITLTTDTTSLISFPSGNAVNVPSGQTSATFPIQTVGVGAPTTVNVFASYGSKTFGAPINLTTAGLASLTFNPDSVAGDGVTTATLTLDGQSGPATNTTTNTAFTVAISGYPLNFPSPPKSIAVPPFVNSVTFAINTPFVTTTVPVSLTATRAASGNYKLSTTSGGFTVTGLGLATPGITITPNSVNAGDPPSTGEVSLAQLAPAGGAVIYLLSDPTQVALSNVTDLGPYKKTGLELSSVIIPAGATVFDFSIQTYGTSSGTTTIKAFRDPLMSDVQSATLTIAAVPFSVSINPTSVAGLNGTAQGTITLNSPAGPTGVSFKLASSNTTVATVAPTTVSIGSGGTTATFTVSTTAVLANTSVTITATDTSTALAESASLTVRAPGVASVVFSSASVHGGSSVTLTITMDQPVPAGGIPISILVLNNQFAVVPATLTALPPVGNPKGNGVVSVTLTTRKVSRDQITTLTATGPGAAGTASLTVTRAY